MLLLLLVVVVVVSIPKMIHIVYPIDGNKMADIEQMFQNEEFQKMMDSMMSSPPPAAAATTSSSIPSRVPLSSIGARTAASPSSHPEVFCFSFLYCTEI
jgi:hypothetical protein